MLNNTQDKGYIMVRVKQSGNEWHLCEACFDPKQGESNFYVDYENGTIYIDTGDSSSKNIIGFYETTTDNLGFAKVFDVTKKRIIGRVGGELIYFRAREADPANNRFMPDEACLAWYTQAGSITPDGQPLTHVGFINGSEIGGAAAFVSLFYSYSFKSIFCDYFDLDTNTFKAKYSTHL